jgi:NADPH:quinone reductase-like Zn-dependent oxidoreductase
LFQTSRKKPVMKAVIYTEYGGPESLRVAEVPKPVPLDNEVLINVHAVSINDWDFALLQPDTFNRLMSGLTKPMRQIIGSDISGKIESVGKAVTKFKIGDEVYGDLSGRWGGFAEYVCAPEQSLALKPANMTFEEAASIPQAAMLAVQGLIDIGNIQSGQKLLINGAGGGVGTFGIQIAQSLGVKDITVVDKESKLDMLRSLGATHCINYTKEDFTKNGEMYDLILDVKTNRSISHYLRVLNPNGKYITVGGDLYRLFKILFSMSLMNRIRKKNVSLVALKANKDLEYMNKLYKTGKLKCVIDEHQYTLEDAPKAMKYFESGDHKGKVVISMR